MTISAQDDPVAAQAAADSVLAKVASGQGLDVPDEPPVAPSLGDTTITLPGGLADPLGDSVRSAEVRELDGEDEEIIARTGANFAKMLDTILQRGVVSVGDERASKQNLDALLAGDRDALLLGIRRATFGDDVEFKDVTCPSCASKQDVTVTLSTDVPTKSLDDPTDAQFDLTLASGKQVSVTLPDGSVQRALANVEEKTEAVLNTVLLSKCLQTIDHVPVMGDGQVRKGLKVRERREVLAAIGERNPGPRLGEVTRPCSTCGEEIPVPLSLVALFLG